MQHNGVCDKQGCRYAHKKEELRISTDLLKTKKCRFFANGHCAVGEACRFAHTVEELREAELVQDMAAAPMQTPKKLNVSLQDIGRIGFEKWPHENSDEETFVGAPEEQSDFESALEALEPLEPVDAVNDSLLDLPPKIDPHFAYFVEFEFSGEQVDAIDGISSMICKLRLRPHSGKYTIDNGLQC
jgi:hypothetical protein